MSGLRTTTSRKLARRWWLLLAVPAAVALGAVAWSASAFEDRSPAEEALALRDVLRVPAGGSVAEIGAGDGRLAVELARLLGPRTRVFATELDPSLLERISQRSRGAGLATVTAVRAAEDGTGLPGASCDAIFMRRVYHDLSHPARILQDIRRTLKPGGRLVVLDFEPTFLGNLLMPRRANRDGHGITKADLLGEVGSAGFVPDGPPKTWDDAMFAAAFTMR